jgi:hypothetical protein
MDASPAPLPRSKWVRFALAQPFLSIGEYFYREQRSHGICNDLQASSTFSRNHGLVDRISRKIQAASYCIAALSPNPAFPLIRHRQSALAAIHTNGNIARQFILSTETYWNLASQPFAKSFHDHSAAGRNF